MEDWKSTSPKFANLPDVAATVLVGLASRAEAPKS